MQVAASFASLKIPFVFAGRRLHLLAVLLVALFAPALQADEGPQAGEVGIGTAVQFMNPNDQRRLDNLMLPGGLFSYQFSEQIGADLLINAGSGDRKGGAGDADQSNVELDLLYWPEAGNAALRPFFLAGISRLDINDGNPIDTSEMRAVGGVGVARYFSNNLRLRADVRGYYGADTRQVGSAITLGLQYVFGSTPQPIPIPIPPPSPPDGDGDGAIDSKDDCPRTPRGRTVDARGCQLDSDGDEVVDALDKCPNTPPDTRVDQRGCPLPKAPITFNLKVQFDFDSAKVRSVDSRQLAEFADFLKKHPAARTDIRGYADAPADIEGHTDSRGTEEYNQRLSELRAKAVVEYLVHKHGVDRSRLNPVGYGESRPIATNNTAQGRQRNRRVTAQVIVQP